MKKASKIIALWMPLAMLISCGHDSQNRLTVFKSRYDNGKYFEEVCKSETDETKVYITTIAVSNHHQDAVKFTVSDFKMSFEDKTYSPIFFVPGRPGRDGQSFLSL